MAASYIENAKRRIPPALRVEHLELIFIRLLHLLAHHPDFGTSKEEILDAAIYIQFYLDLVATSENISLLYHLSFKGKSVRDSESHSGSENFYMMCEIAQFLIKGRAQARSWLLSTYPGKVRLPSDILRPLPTEASNEVLQTTYLPDEANDWLAERFRTGSSKEKKEKKKVPAKRKAPAKNNGHTKRARKKRASEDSDEDEAGTGTGGEDSDVEMADVNAHRKSDASEAEKQTRASRLSARTRAKERLSNGSAKDGEAVSEE